MNRFPHAIRFAWRFLLLAAFPAGLHASTVVINFTVSGFDASAPASEVSGSIQVEINDTTNEVTGVSAVDLTINGHAFSASELGFSEYRNFNILGAQGEGLGSSTGISHGSPYDFWILWNKDTGEPREFAYTAEASEIHASQQFDAFTIQPVE